jgi:hypothetical protein
MDIEMELSGQKNGEEGFNPFDKGNPERRDERQSCIQGENKLAQ